MPYQERVLTFKPADGVLPIAVGGVTAPLNTAAYFNGHLSLSGSSDLKVEVQGILTDAGGNYQPQESDWLTKERLDGPGFHPIEPLPTLIRLKVTAGTLDTARIDASQNTERTLQSEISARASLLVANAERDTGIAVKAAYRFRSYTIDAPSAPTADELAVLPQIYGQKLTPDGKTQILFWSPHETTGAWVNLGEPELLGAGLLINIYQAMADFSVKQDILDDEVTGLGPISTALQEALTELADTRADLEQSAALAASAAGITGRVNLAAIIGADGYYRAMDTGFIYQRTGGVNTRRTDLEAVSVAAITPLSAARNFVAPEMYAAEGDGVTDDTAALNAMFADAQGRTVVMRPFAEYMTGPLTISGQVSVMSNGATLKMRASVSGTTPMMQVAPEAAGSTFDRLTLDGDNLVGHGIDLARNTPGTTWTRLTVRNLKAQGATLAARGFRMRDGCSDTLLDNPTITGVRFTAGAGGVGRGILIADTQGSVRNVRVVNPTITDIDMPTDGDGIVVQDWPGDVDVVIENGTFARCRKRGVKIQNPGVQVIGGNFECTVETGQVAYSAVSIYAPRTRVRGITVTGIADTAAIDIGDTPGVWEDLDVSGNRLLMDPEGAATGQRAGIGSQLTTTATLRRSRIVDNVVSGTKHGYRLQLAMEDLQLSGTFENLTGSAIILKATGAVPAPTRINILYLGLKNVANYGVHTDGGVAPTNITLGTVQGAATFGLFGGGAIGPVKRVATVDQLDAVNLNIAAAFAGEKRVTLPANNTNTPQWLRLARPQAINPIANTDYAYFQGVLRMQPESGNTSNRHYEAHFAFGARYSTGLSATGFQTTPILEELGDLPTAGAVEWQQVQTADGWTDIYVKIPAYTRNPVIDYRLFQGSEPVGAWTYATPPGDGTVVWSSLTGSRQRHTGGPLYVGASAVLTVASVATTGVKGPVLKAAALTAPAPANAAGANPTAAEYNATNARLAELEAKLRTAGVLS